MTSENTYTVTVRYSDDQGGMEAADRLAAVCSEIQDHPDVEAVRSTIPEPTDFREMRTDGGTSAIGNDEISPSEAVAQLRASIDDLESSVWRMIVMVAFTTGFLSGWILGVMLP